MNVQMFTDMGSKSNVDMDLTIPDGLPEALKDERALHDPFEWYRRQRETTSVQYDPQRDVWDVFSYEAVRTGLQDSDRLVRRQLSQGHMGSETPFSYLDTALVWSDGADHKQAKGQLFKYFQPGLLQDLRSAVRTISEAQLTTALADGPEFDFVSDFAVPVPLRVVMDVVGVPGEDHQQMLAWLETFREVMNSEYSAKGSDDEAAMAEAVAYFRDLVAERKADPRDDLISQLARDTSLSDAEIGSNCFDFILAGQGTMSEFLANALYLFDDHDMLDAVLDDGDAVDLSVVLEEVLRFRSPLQSRARQTTEAVTLDGTEIPADETVILWIGAANRDPDQYEAPETFRPERDPQHLAFGNGPHTCIGAPLARLEAPIVLDAFFAAVESVTLDLDAARPKNKASKLGFERLPVAVEPR